VDTVQWIPSAVVGFVWNYRKFDFCLYDKP